jgi:membrane-bound ClpP family serine protease
VRIRLAFTNDPEEIVEELQQEYGRVDQVVRNIVSKLRSLKINNAKDTAAIKMLKHELEDGLASCNIKNLNAQQYYTCPTIADDVIQKLSRHEKRLGKICRFQITKGTWNGFIKRCCKVG